MTDFLRSMAPEFALMLCALVIIVTPEEGLFDYLVRKLRR